jgi:tetratricopeptide (TPR) repeat protein
MHSLPSKLLHLIKTSLYTSHTITLFVVFTFLCFSHSVFGQEICEDIDSTAKHEKGMGLDIIEKGYTYLDRGEYDEAKKEFTKALYSKSKIIRSKAYVGLGDIQSKKPKRTFEAIANYRLALQLDKNSKEAYYALACASRIAGDGPGYRSAAEALVSLICLQPDYRDAYRIWRDSIFDRPEKEVRLVAKSLQNYLAEHPDSAAWWLDLAWYRFDLGETDSSLINLNELHQSNPEFTNPEIHLLSARCCLQFGDSAGFQQEYEKALEVAAATGDYECLFRDAETVFNKDDHERWDIAVATGFENFFFHHFWAEINPDKLAAVNPRLVEHYRRLRYAERNYRMVNPHAEIHNNKDRNLLLTFQTTGYYYDSSIFVTSKKHSRLDQRGLLYVRLGEPDKIQAFIPNVFQTVVRQSGRIINRHPVTNEAWWYGNTAFIFEQAAGSGVDFIFRPLDYTDDGVQLGDMMQAMERQVFQDESIHESEEYYVAQFMGDTADELEVEIYQSECISPGKIPEAAAAAYDTNWDEFQRTESRIYSLPESPDNSWVAVHTLSIPEGVSRYAIKLEAGGETWNGRGDLNLKAFNPEYLELSAIVLGVDPVEGIEAHERHGVRFIPRPSLVFSRGEQIRVYLEYYNLQTGSSGYRSYKEYVDVVRYEGEKSALGRITGKLVGLLTFGEKKENTTITISFDREADAGIGPVAETFFLDSSVLEPGQYRLLIESRDNAIVYWDNEAVLFEIVD